MCILNQEDVQKFSSVGLGWKVQANCLCQWKLNFGIGVRVFQGGPNAHYYENQ